MYGDMGGEGEVQGYEDAVVVHSRRHKRRKSERRPHRTPYLRPAAGDGMGRGDEVSTGRQCDDIASGCEASGSSTDISNTRVVL